MKKGPSMPKIGFLLTLLVLILTTFGVIMVYDTSVVVAYEQWGDKFFLFKNQFVWAGLGLGVMLGLSRIDYHRLKKLALPLLVAAGFLLFLVLVPGLSAETYGARRRLALPLNLPLLTHINLQPSELAKLALVIFLAFWLAQEVKSQKQTSKSRFQKLKQPGRNLLPFILITGILTGLTVLEPDLGTSLIIGLSALLTYFLAGTSFLELGFLGLIFLTAGIGLAFTSSYRLNRLLTFLNPSTDSLGISYHINQLLIALGSGGFLGLGLGHSRQKYQYLPESYTDSIFAIIGEETGFLGAVLIVSLLFLVIFLGFQIAGRAFDREGQLLAGGITALIAVQVLVNLGSVLGLMPLTGVPLPFVSYGGSSLTILLVGVGILLNISSQSK